MIHLEMTVTTEMNLSDAVLFVRSGEPLVADEMAKGDLNVLQLSATIQGQGIEPGKDCYQVVLSIETYIAEDSVDAAMHKCMGLVRNLTSYTQTFVLRPACPSELEIPF